MIQTRKANERGHANHGWLDSFHTFSFAGYHDPRHMGFRTLRVINEDRVQPGQGFGTHGHQDMEIISVVLEGALEHRDSIGSGSVIRPGDVQVMSAGRGIQHSEFNHSDREGVHFLQIWIRPDQRGLTPGYQQRSYPLAERRNQLRRVADDEGREGALRIHQDARVFLGHLDAGRETSYALEPGRGAWVQVVRGTLRLNDETLGGGDAVAVEGVDALRLVADEEVELLLFDLA